MYMVLRLGQTRPNVVIYTKLVMTRTHWRRHREIGASYAEILSNVGLQTLKDRRDCICKKYFNSRPYEIRDTQTSSPAAR